MTTDDGDDRASVGGATSHRSQAAGIGVARALLIRPGIANDYLREAVAAIERVHGDGELPLITMSSVPDLTDRHGRRVDGLFLYDVEPSGELSPRAIRVRIGAPNRLLVALHEIGHVIDLSGLPGAGFASGDPTVSALDGWRGAVGDSQAVQELSRLASSGDLADRQRAENLLQAEELWARSYAQFVASRSGIAPLRADLDSLRGVQSGEAGEIYWPRHWDDDDFTVIANALDRLFRGLGWIA